MMAVTKTDTVDNLQQDAGDAVVSHDSCGLQRLDDEHYLLYCDRLKVHGGDVLALKISVSVEVSFD